MIRNLALLTLLASFLLPFASLKATIIRIPQDEASIQDGCDNANPGDTLRISSGVWEESILIHNKHLTLEGDTSSAEEFVIYPSSGGAAVAITGELSGQPVLRGLTLFGGDGFEIDGLTYGGGIYTHGEAPRSLLIEKCIISGNNANFGGACHTEGIHFWAFGCRFERNSSDSGAVIACVGPASSNYETGMAWSIVAGNTGGTSILDLNEIPQMFRLRNCTVTGNTSSQNLLRLMESQIDIQGTILWQNDSEIIQRSENRTTLLFRYCLVQGGQQSVRGRRPDQWTGNMLEVSPLFTDPEANDYSLQRLSPCIDEGYPYNILDSDGSQSDMGAVPFIHHKGVIITLDDGNGTPVEGATITLTTPRRYTLEMETDHRGVASIFSFPDNAHNGEFNLKITHPEYIDRVFAYENGLSDTSNLNYPLSHWDFMIDPAMLIVDVPRGGQTNTTVAITNNTDLALKWAVQRTTEHSIVNEIDVEDYGMVEGTAFDGEHFYLPNCYANGNRWVYVLDRNGQLVDQFMQPYQDGTGFRSIDISNDSLWAVGDRNIYRLSKNGRLAFSRQINFTGIAITWDDDRQVLWIVGHSSALYSFDAAGNILGSIPRKFTVHNGMSYYKDSPDDYKLYFLTTAPDDTTNIVAKLNPITGDTINIGTVDNRDGYFINPGLNVTTEYDEHHKPVWILHSVDNRQNELRRKLTLVKFDNADDLVIPRISKGVVNAGGRINLGLTALSITGRTDTLDLGSHETNLTIAFDLPTETLTIPVRLNVGPNSVDPLNQPPIPEFRFINPYPNPFNNSVRLSFEISSRSQTILSVVDLAGREVAHLLDDRFSPGKYEVIWDAANFPSGTYIARLEVNGLKLTTKMLLIR